MRIQSPESRLNYGKLLGSWEKLRLDLAKDEGPDESPKEVGGEIASIIAGAKGVPGLVPLIEGSDGEEDEKDVKVQGAPIEVPALLEEESGGEETGPAEKVAKVKNLIDGNIARKLRPHGRTTRE